MSIRPYYKRLDHRYDVLGTLSWYESDCRLAQCSLKQSKRRTSGRVVLRRLASTSKRLGTSIARALNFPRSGIANFGLHFIYAAFSLRAVSNLPSLYLHDTPRSLPHTHSVPSSFLSTPLHAPRQPPRQISLVTRTRFTKWSPSLRSSLPSSSLSPSPLRSLVTVSTSPIAKMDFD